MSWRSRWPGKLGELSAGEGELGQTPSRHCSKLQDRRTKNRQKNVPRTDGPQTVKGKYTHTDRQTDGPQTDGPQTDRQIDDK